jgi:chromate reductase
VFRTLGADLWPGKMLVSRAGTVFDASGKIVDSKTNDALRKFLEGFVAYAGTRA